MDVSSSARTLHSFGHICTLGQDSRRWIVISFRFKLLSLVFMRQSVSQLLSFLLCGPLQCMSLSLNLYYRCMEASVCHTLSILQHLSTAGIYIPPTYNSPPLSWPMRPLISYQAAHPHLPIPCQCCYYLCLSLPVFSSSRFLIQD